MSRIKKIPRTQPVYLTIMEVAIMLGVCRQTVYNMIDREGLPTITIRGVKRIDPSDLDKWLTKYKSA
jgi:excisionase family DNA binding protein